MAVPGRVSAAVPSPQLTLIYETVPSGSAVVKVTVTICPVFAGFGETLVTVAVGGLSFTTSVVWPDPGPALFVAVTVIVNMCDVEVPVLVYTCIPDVAVPARLSAAVPSPQSTVIPVTVTVLETVKVTVTVTPVSAGFGVGLLTLTVGALIAFTVMDPVP